MPGDLSAEAGGCAPVEAASPVVDVAVHLGKARSRISLLSAAVHELSFLPNRLSQEAHRRNPGPAGLLEREKIKKNFLAL
eukprot:scaffold1071_cov252-Pinguiococcus_pyrenoidosus.AAC.7